MMSEHIDHPVEVFLAYAHEDTQLLNELKTHLRTLQQQNRIAIWHDREIIAGQDWRRQVDAHLDTAQVILLLVSPDFMASDYCYGREVRRAMERHNAEEACVIPIILRPVYWGGALFRDIQALPTEGRPVTRWPSHDDAFYDIIEGIRRLIETLPPPTPAITPPPPGSVPVVPPSAEPSVIVIPPLDPLPVVPAPVVPPQPIQPKSRKPRWSWKQGGVIGVTSILLVIAILFIVIIPGCSHLPLCTLTIKNKPLLSPVAATAHSYGGPMGMSLGAFAFDINRTDGNLKQQASGEFQAGHFCQAEELWKAAHQKDTSDAEALIYLEDLKVLASGNAYLTLVIVTTFTPINIDVGRSDLQGAYVYQKEFNDSRKPGQAKVLLLVTSSSTGKNSSDEALNASMIAGQILQLKLNKSFVGVIGWPFSTDSVSAADILGPANIVMISPTASSNFLTNQSPYFFRVVPPDSVQGSVGALYAEKKFHASKVALFFDPGNTYSKSLKESFYHQFVTLDHHTAILEQYTGNQPSTLLVHVEDVLAAKPDLIYIAGYSPDTLTLLNEARLSSFKIMGGDALYHLKNTNNNTDKFSYPSTARNRVYFTAFAFPDEWQGLASQPPFFCDYAQAFDPHPRCPDPNQIYGINRPDADVILAYDATLTFLTGVIRTEKPSPDPATVQKAITTITGAQAIQGASGQISFGPDGNPIQKVVFVLYVNKNGFTQIDPHSLQGCLQVTHCH